MDITPQDIIRFQKAYFEHFGVKTSPQTAKAMLEHLVAQMAAVYKPITRKQLNEYEDANKVKAHLSR